MANWIGRMAGRAVALPLALTLLFALAGPAQARWLEARSSLFDVFSDGDEAQLRAFVQSLQNYDELLRLTTETNAPPSPNRLVIYLVGGSLGVYQVDPHAALGVAGFYAPEVEGVLAVAERRTINEAWASAQAVIFHEYTHHFVNQYYPGVYPAWYQEGFAEYCSTAKFKGDIVTLGEPLPERLQPLFHQPWMPIADVIAPPPYRTSVTSGPMFYPEAWLATHYLLRDDDRRQRLIDYLLALRKGSAPKAAFETSFGMDFPTFQRALVSYLNGNSITYSQIHLPAPLPVAQITVTELPPSADRLLLLRARLIAGSVLPAEAPALVSQVRAAAAAFPDDALALRTLARAEVFFGDPDKADAPLDRLLAAHPDDVEAVYLKAMRYQRAFLWGHANTPQLLDRARSYLQKARKLDPDFYPAAFQLATNLTLTGGWPTEEAIANDLDAHRLAPQVDEITYGAALALLRAKRPADAKPLLEMVAYDPHPTSLSAAARMMLAQANGVVPAGAPGGAPSAAP